MNEHERHRQRVYKRFLREGLAGFEEHNAMEFLLFLAHVRGDTNEIAHAVIDRFGSLSRALDAPYEDLITVKGIGPTSAVVLKFIPQMCAYYLENKTKKNEKLNSSERMADYLRPKFFGKTAEEFYMVALDEKSNILRCVQFSAGTGNATSVAASKIVAEAVKAEAAAVVLAHNHPRGSAMPSASDLCATRAVMNALETVGVTLLDHLIFTETEYLSFADSIYLQRIRDGLPGAQR